MYCSHSQINKYETCPRQYKFYYVNRFRPVEKSANLSFGSAIHVFGKLKMQRMATKITEVCL